MTKTALALRSFRADFDALCSEKSHSRAIIDARTGRVWTYSAMHEAAAGVGALLAAQGIRPGDRVFSILPNGVEQFFSFLASLRLGADFCPISPLSTASEARRFALLCKSAVGLVPDSCDQALAEELRNATSKKKLLRFALGGDLPSGACARAPASAAAAKLILFTSGTVSAPKAIVIDTDRLWSSACAWTKFHSFLGHDSRFYNILPMSYLGGLFNLGLIPLACGGSFVISDAFSAASALQFWQEVRDGGVNTLWLAPTMLRALLALHRPDPELQKAYKQIRVSFLGMAPCGLPDKERFEKTFGIPLLENFALSETTFLSSEKLGDGLPRCPGSTGRPLPWVDMKFEAPAQGAPSEIAVKTPFLFDGYLTASGKIDPPPTADGHLRTGDLGALEDGGILVIKGRSKDVVKKGGYLVMLRELEEAAAQHAAVAEAAAVGVPHDFYGETAIVFVRLRSAGQERAAVEEVAKHLTTVLAKFKWPSQIVAVTEFPKTESGKTQKRLLLERLSADRDELVSTLVK